MVNIKNKLYESHFQAVVSQGHETFLDISQIYYNNLLEIVFFKYIDISSNILVDLSTESTVCRESKLKCIKQNACCYVS